MWIGALGGFIGLNVYTLTGDPILSATSGLTLTMLLATLGFSSAHLGWKLDHSFKRGKLTDKAKEEFGVESLGELLEESSKS